MSTGELLLDHLQRARGRTRGQGQRWALGPSAGQTDAAGCAPEDHAPLLLGYMTEDAVIY